MPWVLTYGNKFLGRKGNPVNLNSARVFSRQCDAKQAKTQSSNCDIKNNPLIQPRKIIIARTTPYEMIPVVSSMIKEIGYDNNKEELHVVFNTDSSYVYERVHVSIFENFLASKSKGKFFNRYIKNIYSFKQE